MDLNDLINLFVQPIGLLCATLVLGSIVGLAIINKDLANRMTVRLIAAIAFADILAHIGEIYASANENLTPGSDLCVAVNVFRIFSRTFYCFTNISICFHLYRSLVLLKKSTWKFELYTWIVTVVMVIAFTVMYWCLGAFTGKENKYVCIPGADDPTYNKIYRLTLGLTDLLTAFVGIFTTIAGRRSLKHWIKTYAQSRSYKGEDPNIFKRNRMKMAERAFLYPLATCITLPIEGIFLIVAAFDVFLLQLTIAKNITLGISGLLTGLAFAVDPATHKAFKEAYHHIRLYNMGCHEIQENASENNINIPLTTRSWKNSHC
jgi:hypothetical protein